MSSHACVLVSGGVESSALLADASARYDKVTPLYIRNHLRWEETELSWLKKFLREFKSEKLMPLKVLELSMRDLYERHWSVTGIQVPDARSKDGAVYLPGRNVVFLAKAACFAALYDISVIEIGVLKANPFHDGSKAFFKKFSAGLSAGLGREIAVNAPFGKLKKEDVILRARKLPLELTFSCLNPKGYEHCGECNKCTERKKAFFAAGVFDKTKYKKTGM